jgi:hypothetical protein
MKGHWTIPIETEEIRKNDLPLNCTLLYEISMPIKIAAGSLAPGKVGKTGTKA